jgi:TonB family protein
VFSLAIMRRRLRADTQTPALVLACAAIVSAESRAVGAVGADQITSVEILTPTEGVDFNGYVTRLIKSVRHNWYAIMPEAARKGEKGKVSVRFHIQQNGTLLAEEPKLESGSGKGPLDRAAVAAVRGSMPFEHLPAGFRGPNIELRVIFLYNLGPESKAGTSDASP